MIFIVAKSSHIWIIYICTCVLLHQKDILLIHYRSYHNESLLRVFPQTHWREVFYPLSRLSCSAWLIGDSKIDLPHKSLVKPLFMSIFPFEQAPISENHTNNIQQQVKAYMKKHRKLIFPYDSLCFATVTLDPLPVLFCNQL